MSRPAHATAAAGRPRARRAARATATALACLAALAPAAAAAQAGPAQAGAAPAPAPAPAPDDGRWRAETGGELRLRGDDRAANGQGLLARAHPLLGRDGVGSAPAAASAELEWRGSLATTAGTAANSAATNSAASGWRTRLDANLLGRLQQDEGDSHLVRGSRVNELQLSADGGGWAFSAGKKVVGWDVGYGFRPNDVVQQETRRTLLGVTPEGRPLLQAEHFQAERAWSLVWVNPQHARSADADSRRAEESALAARAFVQDGAVDWHGFARWGAHTRASLGAAFSTVPGEAWEWHGSLRLLQRHDGWVDGGLGSGATLAAENPWQLATRGGTRQWLLGAQWTGQLNQSLLLEAWHDGSAPSDAQWRAWGQRNGALLARAQAAQAGQPGAPAAAWAGNLAWQATPWDTPNLRRDNLFARLAWQATPWSASLDLLWQPADGGRSLTGSLQWQGDAWRLLAAWRAYGGPSDALLRQLPTRASGLLAAVRAF